MREGSRFDRCHWFGCRASCVDEIELCWYHFDLVGRTFIDKRSVFGADYLALHRAEKEARWKAEREARIADQQDPETWAANCSVVYYIRIDDHVKIGYSIHLRERAREMRVIDPTALLAVEPGGREVERERHRQFAAERIGRLEHFNPSRRLLAHIDVIRAKHGEPWSFTERRVEAAGARPFAS